MYNRGRGHYGGLGYWSGISISQLQSEMSGTTAVFGRDRSLRVTFDGERAESAAGIVTFPALDPNKKVDYNTASVMRGWVDSEAAIFRYAEVDDYTGFINVNKESNPLLADVFKAIECSRVENAYAHVYSGAGKNLAKLAVERVELTNKVAQQEIDHYPAALQMLSRARMPNTYLEWQKRKIDSGVNIEKLEEYVDRIEELSSTRESYELAKEIVEFMKQEHPENNFDPPPQNGDGVGNQGDNKKKNQGGQDKDDDNQSGQAQNYTSISQDDVINDLLSENNIDINYDDGNVPYIPITTEYDEEHHWSQGWEPDIDEYIKARDAVGVELGIAKKKLELLIRATQKIAWDTMKERGRMDSKRLIPAYQANPYVFKVKDDDSDLDTAISICVDLSGSMSGGKSRLAMRTAIIISELLDKINVPFEITGFDAYGDDRIEDLIHKKRYESRKSGNRIPDPETKYARLEKLRKFDYKRFGDRVFDARQYFHYIGSLKMAGKNNIDGESIALAAQSLMKRPEKRKIMFVLSDGQPHGQGHNRPKYNHLQDTVKELEKKIEIIGIGIDSSCVERFYTKHIVLRDARKLPETMLNLMKEHLLDGQKKLKKAA